MVVILLIISNKFRDIFMSIIKKEFKHILPKTLNTGIAFSILMTASLSSIAAVCTNEPSTNVLYKQPVSLIGTFGMLPGNFIPNNLFSPIPSARSLTDELFFNESHSWAQDTIWWANFYTTSSNNEIVINLNRSSKITEFTIQSDTNDDYEISYYDGNNWSLAWKAQANNNPFAYGMITQKSSNLSPITTNKIKVVAKNGDGRYAISEIMAQGQPADCP